MKLICCMPISPSPLGYGENPFCCLQAGGQTGTMGLRASVEESESTMTWPLIQRVLLVVLVATLSYGAAAGQDSLKIAIGQRGGWEQCVSELGQNKGFFK